MNHGVVAQMVSEKADVPHSVSRPFLITFSGIDGAGKTTQINHLCNFFQKQNLRVLRLSFWDNVAVWSNMRAEVGQRSAQDDPNSAPAFSPRNNKHIRKWYLTAARSGLYILDVARLCRLLATPEVRNADVVIFDRYIYDQIANIYSQSPAARLYARMILARTPIPDLAFILDASPDTAFARKPEYPLEFMYRNRRNFLRLRELAPQLIAIPDANEEDVRNEIYSQVTRSRLAKRVAQKNALEGNPEIVVRKCPSPAAELL